MDNFNLKKYLAEGRLLKEGIPQGSEIADYVEGMFNSSVVEKEGFQSDIWRKEQYASNDYREGSVFLDLVDHLKSVGGKDVLEGNPDIHLELLSNDDIQWSADVTLDENLAEGRLFEEISLDILPKNNIAILKGDSGEYEGFIEDGEVSFSTMYDNLDYRITDQYDESNIEDFLGRGHAFVELAKKYDYDWNIEPDLVGITIKL